MRLEIVTPERQLVSADVASVEIPGMDGNMTVMDNHAPIVTTLRPGILKLEDGSEFVVTGGFVEVSDNSASVLAEMAMPRAEASREVLDALLQEATAAVETASEDSATAARLKVNDVAELIRQIG